jgi:hypothetical protein
MGTLIAIAADIAGFTENDNVAVVEDKVLRDKDCDYALGFLECCKKSENFVPGRIGNYGPRQRTF